MAVLFVETPSRRALVISVASLTTAVVLTWVLFHSSSSSPAGWQASRVAAASATTQGARNYLARRLMPAANAWQRRWSGEAANTTRAAFACLVGPGRHGMAGVTLLLRSLAANVLENYPRPVLLFYADDVPPEEYTEEFITSICPPQIRHLVEVHTISFALPEHMRLVALHDIKTLKRYPGYQSMCRWNFMGMMRHPRVRDLDYYCRLDTDSRINSPMAIDMFDYMAENNLHYGYVKTAGERYELAEHMWDFGADWLQTHFSKPAKALAEANGFWKAWDRGHNNSFPIIWNEIEVVHVPRFLERDMTDFADAVDLTNHFFDLRWGDAPLRTIETLLFLNWTAEAQKLTFIDYKHDKANRWDYQPPPPPTVALAPGPASTEIA